MKRRTYPADYRSALLSHISLRLEELLAAADLDAGIYGDLRRAFHKLDLLVVVTYDAWSKWPFKRTPIAFTASLHLAERERLIPILAPQIVDLLLRETSENAEKILLLLTKEALFESLKRFYINEFTGNNVARYSLFSAINSCMEELGILP